MRLTCDPKHDIACIRLRERTETVETVRVSDEIDIDLAADGTELLDANNQLEAADGDRLVLVDATGTERTLPLAG